ncbi:hypothetical protein Cri9333_0571 [Crinalium epipsammum PCC 9333]|uniref:Uncharacterized protein n=1 Tax=Crinalium epipsammum PCC 9333 TaxID=1173022 RepID=K9VU98_9CYAN|nr:hypothetical protein [Crinalium epipsammum]AFZ11521.1 hypothetical protein Cri9333_0571 [Crinalium epipsammum PCC 9333]
MQGYRSIDLLAELPIDVQYQELKEREQYEQQKQLLQELNQQKYSNAVARGRFLLFLINLGMIAVIALPTANQWATKVTGLADVIPEVLQSIPTIPELFERTERNSPKSQKIASAIINYAQQKNWVIRTGARKYNIFYVRGMNPDGTLNDNKVNEFNDLRVVIEIVNNTPRIVGLWEGTDAPGTHYIRNPMNPAGAATIVAGRQYRAWKMGFHKGNPNHPALVQTGGTVTVTRNGGSPYAGYFGINQHGGYDYPRNDIKDASAACLLGRTRAGHAKFMNLLELDADYVNDHNYTFYSGFILGKDLFVF